VIDGRSFPSNRFQRFSAARSIVKTVRGSWDASDHRAEASVLIRSLPRRPIEKSATQRTQSDDCDYALLLSREIFINQRACLEVVARAALNCKVDMFPAFESFDD